MSAAILVRAAVRVTTALQTRDRALDEWLASEPGLENTRAWAEYSASKEEAARELELFFLAWNSARAVSADPASLETALERGLALVQAGKAAVRR